MTDIQEKEYYQRLGQKFKALRKRVGKTAEEVAEEIGVDRALIAQFENNGKKISAYRLNQLLKAFGYQTIDETIDEPLTEVKKKSLEFHTLKQRLQRLLKAAEDAVREMNEETKIELPGFLRAPTSSQTDQSERHQES